MADQFEQAVLVLFHPRDQQLKEQAEAYVASVAASPDCWRLCVERFPATPHLEVRFWCLQRLHEIVSNSYASLDDGARSAVRGALLAWVQATGGGGDDGNTTAPTTSNTNANPGPSGPQQQPQQPSSPPFIRNKLAQVLAAVAVREYLGGAWPSFFRDLARAAAASSPHAPHLADMLARVCASVDADFISLDIPRTQEEARLSMELKDAMRERGDAALLAEAWCACAASYLDAGRADLSAALLSVAARYVHWVDIALVANDAYVPLLARIMRGGPGVASAGAASGQQQQQTAAAAAPVLSPAPLRTAAALVLAEIVSKRMEPVSKIELVQRLDIVPAAAAWAAGLVEAASARQRRRQDRWRERQDRRQRRRERGGEGKGGAAVTAAGGNSSQQQHPGGDNDDAAPAADQDPAASQRSLKSRGGRVDQHDIDRSSSSSSGLDEDDDDDDENEDPEARRSLVLAYSRLLSALAGEVMDSLKRVENSVISMRALGLEVGDDALAEASGACAAAEHLLGQLAPAVLDAFRAAGGGDGSGGGENAGSSEEDARDAVALPLAPFVAAYLARLRALVKRGRTLPQGAREHLRAVLEGVAANSRYPRGGANEGARGDPYGRLPPGDEVAALAAREEQAAVEERRRDLFVLLRAAAKLSLPDAVAFVAGLLQRAVQGEALARAAAQAAAVADGGGGGESSAAASSSLYPAALSSANNTPAPSFQDVEVAVTLLHELGEGAPEQALRPSAVAATAAAGDPNAAPLGALVLSLLTNPHPLPHGRHRLVALAVAEATARYCRVLAAAPDPAAAALPALRALLGDSGVGHPSPDVCHRCAYLLARVVKQLRPALRPLVPDLLATLRPALAAVATTPPPSTQQQQQQQQVVAGGPSSSSSAAAAAVPSSSSTFPSSAAAAAALAALPYPYCVAAGGGGAGGPAAAAAASAAMLAADDRLYLFDAVGLLISPEEALPSGEAQGAALSSLLEPLLRQIEAHAPRVPAEAAAAAAAVAAAAVAAASGGGLAAQQQAARRAAAGQLSGGGGDGAAGGAAASAAAGTDPSSLLQSPSSLWLVAQAMEAVSRLSKAFKNNLVTRSRPALGAMFARCLEASAALVPDAAGDGVRAAHRAAAAEVASAGSSPPPPGALSGAAAAASACAHLRSRLIALVHRMVELLLQAAAPTLPGALGALLRASAPAPSAAAPLLPPPSALPPLHQPSPLGPRGAGGGGARPASATGTGAGAAATAAATAPAEAAAAADPRAAEEVCGLVAQLAQRFGAELAPLAQAVLPAVVERVHSALGPRWDWTGGRAARGNAGGPGLASPSTSAAALLAAAAAGAGGGGGGGAGPANSGGGGGGGGGGLLGTSAAAMASSPMAATSPLCRALAAGGASPLRRAALLHQAGSASARGAASAAAAPSLLAALGGGGGGANNNAGASASTEDEWRERASLQKAYFGLLHACASSGLAGALAALPPGALDAAVGALAAGAAGHVDPSVRRTCLQVFHRLLIDWSGARPPPPAPPPAPTSSGSGAVTPAAPAVSPQQQQQQQQQPQQHQQPERVPGFARFCLERIAGGACVLGVFGSVADAAAAMAAAGGSSASAAAAAAAARGLDPRDAANVALLGDAALALALVASALTAGGASNGPAALAAALEAGPLPASLAPPEARARLLQALRGGASSGAGASIDVREVKDALRAGLQAQRAAGSAMMMTGGSGSGSRG